MVKIIFEALVAHFPFTRRNIIIRSIDKSAKTLLDLGFRVLFSSVSRHNDLLKI